MNVKFVFTVLTLFVGVQLSVCDSPYTEEQIEELQNQCNSEISAGTNVFESLRQLYVSLGQNYTTDEISDAYNQLNLTSNGDLSTLSPDEFADVVTQIIQLIQSQGIQDNEQAIEDTATEIQNEEQELQEEEQEVENEEQAIANQQQDLQSEDQDLQNEPQQQTDDEPQQQTDDEPQQQTDDEPQQQTDNEPQQQTGNEPQQNQTTK